MTDFDEAIDRVVAGLERKSRVMNLREKEIVAYHEAGHAGRRVPPACGHGWRPTEDRYLTTRSELLDRLDVLLGGRVAEEPSLMDHR